MKLSLTKRQTEFWDVLFDDQFKIKDNSFIEFYAIGGFGSGKSRVVASAVHTICLMYPKSHGVYIRGTYPELKDSVIPQFINYFPEQENGYTFNKSERVCEYANGTRLDFRAFDKDTKILSNEYDFMAFSQVEELPEELFLQSLGRNRRRQGGIPKNLLLAEGNPSSGWLKKRVKDKQLTDKMYLLEVRTRDNPYLPEGYEANLRANYPNFWVARYLDGEWSNLDEAVFSEFRESRDIIEPSSLDHSFKRRAGLDYGWVNPSALVWSFVDYDGNVTIYDCWKSVQKTPAEIAKEAKRYGPMPIIADYSIKKADRDGRSLWQDLLVEGLNLVESNKQELENIVLVNSLLKQGRLKITRNCFELIEEIRNYKWKKLKLGEEKNHPEQTVNKDNHLIDAMLYMIADIEELKTVRPEIEKYKQSMLYKTIQQRNAIGVENLS